MATHLVWFRHDLRVIDNLALSHACQDPDATVIALFIATPEQWRQHGMSARQATFIFAHLQKLQLSLAALNIPLIYQQVNDYTDALNLLVTLCDTHQVTDLFYNYQYEYNEQQRDKQLAPLLNNQVVCHGFHDSLLLAPGAVLTGQGQMYKVYTPFRHAFVQRLLQSDVTVHPAPAKRTGVSQPLVDSAITVFNYPQQASPQFDVGESSALQHLGQFCRERVADYLAQRNFPARDMTSRLSCYLAIGVLSPRQCFARLSAEHPQFLHQSESSAFCWFNELVWREFYRHLLLAYPRLSQHKPFIGWTDKIKWRDDESLLQAWQQGLTGYPIIDAAMRQLNQTGWMHNRLRMITASFLVKDLLIDWRKGERYFMSQLIDGDLAANNGGWQWAASTGTDAAPYFRIFNPSMQGQRFDKNGDFIRQWLPELQQVPIKYLHTPHVWAEKQGVTLRYPKPIIDHKQARLQTLAAFELAKKI